MSVPPLELPSGRRVPVDEKGYLLDRADWSPEVAEFLAERDGVALEDDHWAIIALFQDFYEQFEIEPPMRALVKRTREKLGEEKGNSRYLYRLFPDGPQTQACRYAGLPRPLSCV